MLARRQFCAVVTLNACSGRSNTGTVPTCVQDLVLLATGWCQHCWTSCPCAPSLILIGHPKTQRPPAPLVTWRNPQARALRGWLAWLDWKKRMQIILQRAAVRLTKRQLIMAWEAWWQSIHDRKLEEQLTTKEQLVVSRALAQLLQITHLTVQGP